MLVAVESYTYRRYVAFYRLIAARQAGATVLERTGPTIAAQRNAAIGQARNEWILALDADERVSDVLRDELSGITGDSVRHVH